MLCCKSQTINLPHSSVVSCYSISHFNLKALCSTCILSWCTFLLCFHCYTVAFLVWCGELRSQWKRKYNKHKWRVREANCSKMPNHTEIVREWQESTSLWPLEFWQLAAHWSPFTGAPALLLRPVAFKPQRVDERLSWEEKSVNRIRKTGGIMLSTQMHPSSLWFIT